MNEALLFSQQVQGHAADLICDSLPDGQSIRFRVISNSMHPTIERDDWVTVRRARADALQRGDVVCLRRGNSLVVHRVIELGGMGRRALLTRGDSCLVVDPLCAPENLLGVVCLVHKPGKVLDLQSWRWRVLNRVVGLLFYIQSAGPGRLLHADLSSERARHGLVLSTVTRLLGTPGRLGLRLAVHAF